jgi:putative spermidine/putrescine transport system substrate-binding protein
VRNGPNPEQGKRVLDFLLSEDGQRHWGNAMLRPVFAEALSPEARARFLPDSDYARARPLDLMALAAAATAIAERYQRDVG